MHYSNRQWFYVKRPSGRVGDEHYELRESAIDDTLSTNEVLIRAHFISVDPYIRIQQAERNTYDLPHPLGIVQRAGVVGPGGGIEQRRFRRRRLGRRPTAAGSSTPNATTAN